MESMFIYTRLHTTDNAQYPVVPKDHNAPLPSNSSTAQATIEGSLTNCIQTSNSKQLLLP